METRFLLLNRFKKFGWVFLCLALLLWIYSSVVENISWLNLPVFCIYCDRPFANESLRFFGIIQDNFALELICLLFITGSLLVAFSKVKQEDEFILKIRLESLVWATYLNFFVLVGALLFVYGGLFLEILFVNFFTFLFLFIIRFHWVYYQAQRSLPA